MPSARIPPHSLDAEKSVLGALLIDRDVVVDVIEILRPEMFYSENHGLIFGCVMGLYENRDPIDVVTLSQKLKEGKNLERIGGRAYLSELSESVPSSANAEKYAAIIKESFIKRQLIGASANLTDLAFDESQGLGSILDQAEQS